jgi:hypothetical protein
MEQNQKPLHSTPENNSLTIGPYTVSFNSERHYQRLRHHWLIFKVETPDELVSWGHASTRRLAELAAQEALAKLLEGCTVS